MKAKTELFLYHLFWLAEKPLRPTFRSIEAGFEEWAYHSGMLRQIRRLEARGYLESSSDPVTGGRLHRLTEAGRISAMGGRDPDAAWSSPWDQKWRLFLFDIPETERSRRRKLTRALAAAGCGCLQGSVWIAPRVSPSIEELVSGDDTECSQMILLLAESKGKRVDARMVAEAWDFEAINALYRDVNAMLDRFSKITEGGQKRDWDQWASAERAAWKAALSADPLLPPELLPKDYLGRKAWLRRKALLPSVVRSFSGKV